MTRILPPPERVDFEREIKRLIADDGDLTSIAGYVHRDRGIVSKMFNPDTDEKHNPVYQFVIFLWVFDCLRDGLADEILKIVIRERDKWTARRTRILTNPAETTSNIGIQFSEFLKCEMEGKAYDCQINECDDIIRAAELKKQELIEKRNEHYYGGKPE